MMYKSYHCIKCILILWILAWLNLIYFFFLQTTSYKITDLMRTFVEHVACKLADACASAQAPPDDQKSSRMMSILVTGGGAFNVTLVEAFRNKIDKLGMHLESPDKYTINFKEALVFAFLGLKCIFGECNIFRDVTGSESDSVSGSIHLPVSTTSDYCISYFQKKKSSGWLWTSWPLVKKC